MSTNIFESPNLQVTRFACGKCREAGPCFQITGDGGKTGDYVILHRALAHDATYAILRDIHSLGRPEQATDPCVEDQHRGTECKCCHVIEHCCSHHCCCFYRCVCRHAKERHPDGGKCDFGDGCSCQKYVGR